MGGRLPEGKVTFLFTDIEASTQLLQHLGDDVYGALLEEHHRILREAIAAHAGVEVSTEGDAFFVVFADASDALAGALEAQRALAGFTWPEDAPIRVRMGLHTGAGKLGGDNYVGLAVHQAARIAASGHGGQVVVSETTNNAVVAPPESAWVLSLGRHRFKDLGAAIEVFQLGHADLPADFPPLRTLGRVAHNLPVQLSSFVGRDEELAEGAKLLLSTRLLSVVGAGGTGKTRLAYQLAAEELAQFPDGVSVVELAGVTDPELVPAALMSALAVRSEPGRSAIETIVGALRDRRVLVLFDNCEHIVDAVATVTADLLQACVNLRVLATTREPLRVPGETVWMLPPLSLVSGEDAPLELLVSTDAVALFTERAAEAKTGFALTPENAHAVTAICALVEGLPLAIELAAARVRTIPLPDIADRLTRSFDLLSKGDRGVAARQASIAGTIAWSYDLLSAAEQVLFRRLAVFSDGFTLDAVQEVCAGDGLAAVDLLDLLDALVDKSLVALGDDRYRLLAPIRLFASERLRLAGEDELLADLHAAFYARLAFENQGVSAEVLDRLDREHHNVLAALLHLSQGDQPEEHGRLVTRLAAFWDVRGHWSMARRELQAYIDRSDGDPKQQGAAAGRFGVIAISAGDYAEAEVHLRSALAVAREFGDREAEGHNLGNLATVARVLRGYPEARALLEEAIAISRELGDRFAEGRFVGNLGLFAADSGDFVAARSRCEEALEISRELGDRHAEIGHLTELGRIAYQGDDYRTARTMFEGAKAIAQELGDRRADASVRTALGRLSLRLGDRGEARALFEQALTIFRDLGDRPNECAVVGSLGHMALVIGDYAQAEPHIAEALEIAREIGARSSEGVQLGNLGFVAAEIGSLSEARTRTDEALAIARELGDPGSESVWLGNLGMIAFRRADHGEAKARYEDALRIATALGWADGDLVIGVAELLATIGNAEEAALLLGAVDEHGRRAGRMRTSWEQARYETVLASCLNELGEDRLAAAIQSGAALNQVSVIGTALQMLQLAGVT